MTPESAAALADLRQGGHFEWHIVCALAFVIYAYARTAARGQLDRVVLGAGFWAVELLWEMFNGLILHFTQRSALWTVAGKSSFLIYVGLNVEISLMFAVVPLVLFDLLPDRELRVAGRRIRPLVPIGLGVFCVAVECLLNRMGALVWEWPFWRWPHVELILVAYCGPIVALTWIHERASLRAKAYGAAAALVLAGGCHALFAGHLRWV